jgi:hypothetical protein
MSNLLDVPSQDTQSRQFLIDLFRPILADLINEALQSLPTPEPQEPKPLTVEGVAELTDNSVHWVYKNSNKIPGKMRVGGRIYWDRATVISWMKGGR